MSRSRWFQVIICLLVVCCLLFNMSPIRAEALVIETSAAALGIAACLLLVSLGVVMIPETTNQLQAMGRSLQSYMTNWASYTDRVAITDEWLEGTSTSISGSGGGDEDPTSPDYRKIMINTAVMSGLVNWVCDIFEGKSTIEEEVETAPDGYMYYGEYLHPVLPTYDAAVYPYLFIGRQYNSVVNKQVTHLYLANLPLSVKSVGTNNNIQLYYKADDYADSFAVLHYTLVDDYWEYSDSSIFKSAEMYNSVWSNYDLIFNGAVVIPGSIPSPVKTEPLLPDTYVGDIPEQIRDGSLDRDDIVIPNINYGALMQDGQTLQDATIGTLHKLTTGELSYENFMEQIKVDSDVDDPGTGDTDVTEPVPDIPGNEDPEDQPEEWKPPTNPNAFALDLSKFFPFCIPFDLYDFFSCLNADPVAPVIEWQIPLPGGSAYPIKLDLSVFDPVARILRTLELLAFCVGLAFKTRDLIRG